MSEHVVPDLGETTSASVSDKVTTSETFNKTLDDIWGTYDPHVVDDDEFIDCCQLRDADHDADSAFTPIQSIGAVDGQEVKPTNFEPPEHSRDQHTSSETSYSGPLVLNPNIPSTTQYEGDAALFANDITPVDTSTEYEINETDNMEHRKLSPEEVKNAETLDSMQRHFYATTQCHFDQYLEWHEEQKADPEATASQPTMPPPQLVHHFNFFGNPVYTRNFTNPLYSLRLILRGSYHSMDTSPLRQTLLTHQVVSKIDPVIFAGPLDELLALSSLSPEDFLKKLCGRAIYCYAPYGQFACDQLSQDDYQVAHDPMNLECYKVGDKENTILNGWYKRQNSEEAKTASEFYIISNINAHQLIFSTQERCKERRTQGPTRSRLCEVMNVDDEADHGAKSTSSEEQDAKLWTSSEDEESDATAPEDHYCPSDVEMKDVDDLDVAESDSYSVADVVDADPLLVETTIPSHITDELTLAFAIPLPLDIEVDYTTLDVEVTVEDDPAAVVSDEDPLLVETPVRGAIAAQEAFGSSIILDAEAAHEEGSAGDASDEDRPPIDNRRASSHVDAEAMFKSRITPDVGVDSEEDPTTDASDDDPFQIEYGHLGSQIDAAAMFESSTDEVPAAEIGTAPIAVDMTDEPSKVKVSHYWTKLRKESPLPLQTTSKPTPKKSLRNTLKKAAWKLVPWALRPVGT